MIALTDLVFRWPRQPTPCLDIPHFALTASERIFLHGPSGSGKSTLFALLGGIVVPEHGEITLLDTRPNPVPHAAAA